METATLLPNTIVPEVLEKDNYKRWSILIKHYLVAQDVWDVVEPSRMTEETNERLWIKKNALALHAIKISCGAKAFDLIKNIESARDAWKALLDMPKVPVYHDIARRHEFMFMWDEIEVQSLLHDCIYDGSKRGVEDFFHLFPQSRSDQRVLKSALHVAINAGQEDIARFFYELIDPQELSREDHFILLEECITKKMFKFAWDLLNRFPELNETPEGYMQLIFTLAKTPPPFFRGSQLNFVTLCIYPCIVVDVDLNNPSVAADDASGEEHSCYQSCLQFLKVLLRKSVATLWKILAKQTYDRKSTDVYAGEVVKFLCEKLQEFRHDQLLQNRAVEAIFEAIKNGIPEIAIKIARARGILQTSTDPEDHSRTMVAYAIAHRQEEVAKYLYKYKTDKFYDTDEDGNKLHLAAKLAPPLQLDRISGAALQLQSELRWFKSVEAIVPGFYTEQKNKDGETPYQVFVKEHKNLLKEAEEWMKKTAESSTVVGALIITIMFAAAFTVPGGNDQNTGFPIFLNATEPTESFTVTPFKVFIVSDAISLFTASSSVFMFLGILTSRYAYEDFLISLPRKLIVGISSLFISIATLTVAFCATLYVMLRGQRKEVIPITVLGGIPIMCFALLQFRLLVEIIALTLRPYIFDRKTATAQLVELLAGYIPILASVLNVVKTRLIGGLIDRLTAGRKRRKVKRQMSNLGIQMTSVRTDSIQMTSVRTDKEAESDQMTSVRTNKEVESDQMTSVRTNKEVESDQRSVDPSKRRSVSLGQGFEFEFYKWRNRYWNSFPPYGVQSDSILN